MIAQIEDVKKPLCRGINGCHNTSRNKQKLQQIASVVLDQAGLAGKLYPQERDFISTASRLIVRMIEEFLSPSGNGTEATVQPVRPVLDDSDRSNNRLSLDGQRPTEARNSKQGIR
ncbi:hypothetical protein LC612_37430 [Nostoc sp. CHAB 5834]|nr:hypothetical protein [Nostoc sp. CHAB 5834]